MQKTLSLLSSHLQLGVAITEHRPSDCVHAKPSRSCSAPHSLLLCHSTRSSRASPDHVQPGVLRERELFVFCCALLDITSTDVRSSPLQTLSNRQTPTASMTRVSSSTTDLPKVSNNGDHPKASTLLRCVTRCSSARQRQAFCRRDRFADSLCRRLAAVWTGAASPTDGLCATASAEL